MWELYEELIAGIPEELTVEEAIVGSGWTLVRAGGHAGIALTVRGQSMPMNYDGPVEGVPLRRLAEGIKSWNFIEASIGTAAINAYYNAPPQVEALGGFRDVSPDRGSPDGRRKKDAFLAFADIIAGRRVAVIGRFPHIEQQLKPICTLSVLERDPRMGDYPDSACEYILPEQDFVFITGMTLINKTLPRLLQIVGGCAKVSLVGPSVPLTPILFSYGADNLSGFSATEPGRVKALLCRGVKQEIFSGGHMVSIDRPSQ